jgi:D-alanyl-D-alanine carboxypeptidase/D-alanyl-D-alanine-endopeptidase (penicillin-binding protein 4)
VRIRLTLRLGAAVALLAVVCAATTIAAGGTVATCSYRVRAGDTLSGIAQRFHTTVAALAQENSLDPNALLPIGLRLRVGAGSCSGAAAAPVAATAATPHDRATLRLMRALGVALQAPSLAPSAMAAIAVDLRSGKTIYALNAALPLAPASEEKLPLSFAALQTLGTGFTTETDVFGRGSFAAGVWRGDLVLKGYGDPTLSSGDLALLARQIRARGVTEVRGSVVGDESFFDSSRTVAGWKPSFYKTESPPLSALTVDRATLDGATVNHPALAGAILFTRALAAAGVHVSGRAEVGNAGRNAVRLGRVPSPTLRRLLGTMDAWSDNFMAETLLKELGARQAGDGSSSAGATVVTNALAALGVPGTGMRIVDGSGLSLDDRISAQALATILVAAWRQPRIRRPLYASLAVAGVSGTLRHRLPDGPGHGIVHAKSGTTDECSALAGYVGDRYAFVVLENGRPVDWVAAHAAQDRFVQLLAGA